MILKVFPIETILWFYVSRTFSVSSDLPCSAYCLLWLGSHNMNRDTQRSGTNTQSQKAKCRSLCTRYGLCPVPVKPCSSAWCSKKSIMAADVLSDHIIIHHTPLQQLLIINIWGHEYKWISTEHPKHPHSVLKADGMDTELMTPSIKALLKS